MKQQAIQRRVNLIQYENKYYYKMKDLIDNNIYKYHEIRKYLIPEWDIIAYKGEKRGGYAFYIDEDVIDNRVKGKISKVVIKKGE